MAPTPDRLATTKAMVDGGELVPTLGFQPRILPSSLANRNRAAPDCPLWLTTKSDVPLKTVPVGPPPTLTTSGRGLPEPSYRVDLSVPLSETHQGVEGPATRPQPLTRLGSFIAAWPARSATSLCTV